MKCRLAFAMIAAAIAAGVTPAVAAEAQKRPNILLIVADDLGYTDLGTFGSEIATPNLDRLADTGTRLTNFYASPFCSPTRAMLMSGSDNHLVGFGDMAELMTDKQRGKPGYEGFLNDKVVPMPQVLRDTGYRTVMAGKWHLGNAEQQSPAARGFDRSYAMTMGGASHFGDQSGIVAIDPNKPPKAIYREDGKSIDIPRTGFYSSVAFTDKIMEYLEQTDSSKPFFAYLAFTAPHWPLHAPDADIKKYENRYREGYEKLRLERLALMKQRGIPASALPPYRGHSHWPAWDTLSDAEKAAESRRMAVYAAMVDNMDQQIGRLLKYLETKGELGNTFIFFMSDNGADGNSVYDVAETRNWIHKDMDNSIANTGRPGSFVEYGPGWAQVGMTPFKLYKSFMYEGGISVPAIAWGPNIGVGKELRTAVGHVTDVAPTIFEIAGAKHPGTEYHGKSVLPLRGKSMLPYFQGKAAAIRGAEEAIGWELGGRKALRKGDWKIVYANVPWGTGKWELYNITQDRTESNNVADKNPAKMEEMLLAWQKYVAETGTLEIEGLASRPGYSNAGKYYEDLDYESKLVPRAQKP
ncbi:MAG: arylsulfatase [Rhodocyclaceae bacterium]|nr:arylsulfatase [Rhodocyclaceae bacterium]MBX3669451.1 arylsulfatase [Rhodocyclaceae bacterium]